MEENWKSKSLVIDEDLLIIKDGSWNEEKFSWLESCIKENPTLKKVSVVLPIPEAFVPHLMSTLSEMSLETLDFNGRGLSGLSALQNCSTLRQVAITAGVMRLSVSEEAETFKYLNMVQELRLLLVRFVGRGFEIFCNALHSYPSLRLLEILGCGTIEIDGMHALGRMLNRSPKLRKLSINGASLASGALEVLGGYLERNRFLRDLDLGGIVLKTNELSRFIYRMGMHNASLEALLTFRGAFDMQETCWRNQAGRKKARETIAFLRVLFQRKDRGDFHAVPSNVLRCVLLPYIVESEGTMIWV